MGVDESGPRDEHGVLIGGHLRVAAAARLGFKSIPVIVARGWSEEEKQAYRLADNELAARGSWDPDLLFSELRDLKFSGFDLDLIGFEPHRLEARKRHGSARFRKGSSTSWGSRSDGCIRREPARHA